MGTRKFGSGYPGIPITGVAGRGFPFVFWPLAWGGAGAAGATTYHYLDNSTEYGPFDNSSRPGGVMTTAAFTALDLSQQHTTFHILADNFTVNSLIEDIHQACGSLMPSSPNITAAAYNDSLPAPKPEQAVQYYRASTVCLSLDGCNNTALFDNSTDTPLPTNINTSLLDCINSTIASNVPLVDAQSTGTSAAPSSYQTLRSSGTRLSANATIALLSILLFWTSKAF
ncbi:hypothetical protein CPB83DRAFT_661662 [Crepidotus variabilis]|uniref:Uncharacterized protein n=1 Tax=Crepidotus variabilis TaxID=179855 RepID=A0A9P6EP85_9AGAR|nr:hypothetical protein CPB83DRAFT_661662 [Crepidotus variabilis]